VPIEEEEEDGIGYVLPQSLYIPTMDGKFPF
jgi:hypothetical protein